MILSDSPIAAEIVASIGYDYIILDHEHSPTNARSGQAILQAMDAASTAGARRTEPMVRLPTHENAYMKKVLDSLRLPGGVMVPMVEDAGIAQAVVDSTRYPTAGIRGCAAPYVRASGWGSMNNADYLQQCRQDLLVMVQVETIKGVEHIPEIAAVDGIDAIFLGPFDLSASLGKMGQFDDMEVQRLMESAETAVLQSEDCLLAGFRQPGRDTKAMFDAGYNLVCGSADVGLLRDAARRDLEAVKSSMD